MLESWDPDDIKGIDDVSVSEFIDLKKDLVVHLTTSKTFKLSFKSQSKKNDTLLTIITICQSESRKMPKLGNIDLKKITKSPTIDLQLLKSNQESQISYVKRESISKKIEKLVPELDLNQILNNFKWEVSGDASALEKSLQEEIVALEAVISFILIRSLIYTVL